MNIVRQFLQYVFVGGLAFGIDFATLFLLTDKLALHYLVSATIAFLIGLAVNYALCVTWIFDVRTVQNRGHEFLIFSIIGLIGLALNNGLMYALTDAAGLHYLQSKLFAAAAILVFNFAFRRSMLFTERRTRVPSTTESAGP